MDQQFWLDKWAQDQIGFHEAQPHPCMLEFWPQVADDSHAAVFVPLCGKSNDMPWLAGRGHSIVGVEISDIAVRDFFDENGIASNESEKDGMRCTAGDEYDIYCADIFEFAERYGEKFNLIYDRAALIALAPEQRTDYAGALTNLAAGAASMLLITVDYDADQISPPPHIVAADEIQSLFGYHWTIDLLKTSAADVKGQPGTETTYHLRRKQHAG